MERRNRNLGDPARSDRDIGRPDEKRRRAEDNRESD